MLTLFAKRPSVAEAAHMVFSVAAVLRRPRGWALAVCAAWAYAVWREKSMLVPGARDVSAAAGGGVAG